MRLLRIGLLEQVKGKSRGTNRKSPHLPAENPRESADHPHPAAAQPHENATEGNRTEENRTGTDRKETLIDSRSDSRKTRANTDQPDPLAQAVAQADSSNVDDAQRSLLRSALQKHFAHELDAVGTLDTPSNTLLDRVVSELGQVPIEGYIKYLDNLPRRHQAGGGMAARTWGWYVQVARNYAAAGANASPVYGGLTEQEFKRMTNAIDIPGEETPE